jgi:hypothetical protein
LYGRLTRGEAEKGSKFKPLHGFLVFALMLAIYAVGREGHDA